MLDTQLLLALQDPSRNVLSLAMWTAVSPLNVCKVSALDILGSEKRIAQIAADARAVVIIFLKVIGNSILEFKVSFY